MKKSRDEMSELDDKIELSIYHINNAKSAGNEIAEIMTEIRMSRQMVEEGLLGEKLYENYVQRRKKDVKNLIAHTYSNMQLDKIEGNLDRVFEKEETK